MFPSVLIVDDEPSILQSLSGLLSDEGFEVITASNGYEALQIIDRESPDLVLLDIWMPGIDGIEALQEIKKDHPSIQVIIITGHGTIETAVKATKLGAFDFIEKPLSIDKVIVAINNSLNFRRLEEENRYLRKKTIEKHSLTGNSPAIVKIREQIAIAAPTDAWILITGENGTGKELVARTIHQLSSRADKPLIDVHCAAIPEDLFESELFGYEKGAFQGAVSRKKGKLELAGKGTIFLDEIGDMSLRMQGKLLRVFQELKYQRLGGTRTLTMDARVIASSNKDLEREIEIGNFREDLYYRLNVIPIEVPPLRARIDDIPMLIKTFLDEIGEQNREKQKTISPDAMQLLQRYNWPGNVRELKNLMARLVIMARGDTIEVSDIPAPYNSELTNTGVCRKDELFSINDLKVAKKAFEKEFIKQKLKEHNHNITQTAKAIGVGRSYLHKKLKD
ncbi:MAG: sigma-54-dependent Fis family transcriptional regulator [Deltaproteobacteria bacterium]|nr:sigma-54-dependent Fis family transcriptional regulator [Deltaproteobacteria bacterium]MBW1960372.1 sigma-54-dependent Fis family transcriptional regulator [Deltaproteobacteria bacterium]MBW2151630.1 sigma-54-dependent Fis family transcriptional regulator [Deltaproteobacteria bacterium]